MESEGKPFRITGITFDGTGLPDAGVWAGAIVIDGNCKNFRVDHCKFLNMDRMMTIHGDTYGLIDHCYFHVLKKNRLAQTICCMGPGKATFTRPLTLGTDQAVYFEDNEAHFSPEVVEATGNNPWIVPYDGARVVIRHNKIVNTQLEIYRVRPGAYGCQSAEIYDNDVLRRRREEGPAAGIHHDQRRRRHGVQQHGDGHDLQHPLDPSSARTIVPRHRRVWDVRRQEPA